MPAERGTSDCGPYGIRPIATAGEQFLFFQQFIRKLHQQSQHFQHHPQHLQQFVRHVE